MSTTATLILSLPALAGLVKAVLHHIDEVADSKFHRELAQFQRAQRAQRH